MLSRYITFLAILSIPFLAGCSHLSSPEVHAQPRVHSISTPELASGSESQNRQGNYKLNSLKAQFPDIIFYSGPHSVKLAALTFDDGPDVYYTGQILDILKHNGVKATFFVVGQRALAHPEMIQRIAGDGHAIGNHSWDHRDVVKLTPVQVQSEVSQTDRLLNSILGYHPTIFRAPYGALTPNDVKIIAGMGDKVIGWSVDTRDWAKTPPPQILRYVRKEMYPGGIILQHSAGGKGDDLSNTLKALPQIIVNLRAQGYTFVTVPQLLNIPGFAK